MRLARLVPVLAASAACAACASTSPRGAFRETASAVEARTGRRLAWDRGGEEDAAVADRIRRMLAAPLTPDGAVQIALLENRGLRATYEDLALAQADLVQAGLLQNPVFGVGVAIPVAGTARTGVSLSVVEDFLGVFALAARKRVARADLAAAEARVGGEAMDVVYDVLEAYYALLASEQTLAMRRTILEAEEGAVDLVRRQRESGNVSDLDAASQEVLYEQMRADLTRGEADVVTRREALTRRMGLWGAATTYRVLDKLPEPPATDPPLDRLESLAVGRRLDLVAARARAQAASHALAMARNFRFLGGASVGAGYERSPEGFSTLGPQGSLEVPIFDQKRAAVARAEAALRAASARETALAVDVRSEVREARARVVASRAVVDRYARTIVPLRRRVVALSMEQYNAMLLGTYQLLQARQAEVNAYREFIEALRDYWIARTDLERATGGTLPETT